MCTLQGNYIRVIDKSVQSDIREAYTKVRNNSDLGVDEDRRLSKIQSFGNITQKLYGVSFPRVGSTGDNEVYIFNLETEQWTKSDQQFTFANVRDDGRLTTIDKIFPYTSSPTTTAEINAAIRDYSATKIWTILREDKLTSGFEDDADQFDEAITLTGTTIAAPSTTSLSLTRTSATPSTVENNMEDTIYRIRNRDLWYYFSTDDVYKKATITDVSGNLVIDFGEDISALTTNAANDILYVGVTVDIKFNRFYPSSSYTNIDFEQASFFDIGTYDGVTLSFGNGLSTDFDEPSETDTVSDVWRAYIPTNASSGTHIISRVQHSRPLETFQIAGHGISYTDTGSEDVGRNNC